jgi:hypothetical protein
VAFDVLVSVVALLSGTAAALGGAYIRRTRTGPGGPSGPLLAAAATTTAWTVVVAALSWTGADHAPAAALVGAAGVVVAVSLLIIGVLRLPAVVATRGARVRRGLDAAQVTLALLVTEWIIAGMAKGGHHGEPADP